MSSTWTENLVESIGDLPQQMQQKLKELRGLDRVSRQKSNELSQQEAAFLEEVKEIVKQHGSNFDEAQLRQRADELIAKRQELAGLLDEQMKKATSTYTVLDAKIKSFDSNTKEINSLFYYLGADMDGDGKSRKKKRKSTKGEEVVIAAPVVPTGANEPTYCICRRVQFGEMVACDNDECEFEWFHYACVNLKSEPTDKWYCPPCSLALAGPQTTIEPSSTSSAVAEL